MQKISTKREYWFDGLDDQVRRTRAPNEGALSCRGFDIRAWLGLRSVFREKALHRGVVIIAGIAAMLGEMKLFQLTKAWLSVGIMTRPAAVPMSEVQELRQQVAALKAEVVDLQANVPVPTARWRGRENSSGFRREGRRFRLSRDPRPDS